MLTRRAAVFTTPFGLLLSGCVQNPELQAAHFTPATSTVDLRSVQSRRFDTLDEQLLLQAVAGVLQDLGFQIEESRPRVGLIMGSKERSAIEAAQVAGQILLALLAGAAGVQQHRVIMDRDQRIRIAVMVRRAPGQSALVARATMQRVVINTENRLSRIETLDDARLYQEFFSMLSQSVFLTAHEV